MKCKVRYSAPTLEGLRLGIAEYFCNPTTLILHTNGDIETGRGVLPSLRWRKKSGRFQAYEIQESKQEEKK